MKNLNKILCLITLSSSVLLQACSGMDSKAGNDSAYLNKNRGASGAQVSSEEARQYRRQQGLSANEVQLENMKRRQTTDSVQEKSSATRSAVGAVRSLKSLGDMFK